MKETLGERIRRMREARQMGLRELARAADISATYLSRIEGGKDSGSASLEALRRLAIALGDSFDALAALAGKIPEDIERYLLKDPELFAALRLAEALGYTGDDLCRAVAEGDRT